MIDGTHLYGKYKGCLLTASCQDANFQVFPIGFAVVDSQNDESWKWFMHKLSNIIVDGTDLTIVSDRHGSIYKAIAEVYPKVCHGAYLVHLRRNVKNKFKKRGRDFLASLVWQASEMFMIKDFKRCYEHIKRRDKRCWVFLEEVGVEHWTKAYCPGQR